MPMSMTINDENEFYAMSKEERDNITFFDFNNFQSLLINDDKFVVLIDILKGCKNLKTIKNNNFVSALMLLNYTNFKTFCDTIVSCKNLQTIDLSGSQTGSYSNQEYGFDSAKLQLFLDSLVKCENLQEINFRYNSLYRFSKEKFEAICNTIAKCKKIKRLDLSKNKIDFLDEELSEMLIGSLAELNNLQTLDLADNNFHSSDSDSDSDSDADAFDIFMPYIWRCKRLQNIMFGDVIMDAKFKCLIDGRKRASLGADHMANIELLKKYKISSQDPTADKDLTTAISILLELPNELRLEIISYAVECESIFITDDFISESFEQFKPLFEKHKALQDEAKVFENLQSQINGSFKSQESRLVLSAYNDYKVREYNAKYNESNPGKAEDGFGPMAIVLSKNN